jgi:hypothetical protein
MPFTAELCTYFPIESSSLSRIKQIDKKGSTNTLAKKAA